jgi:hypothetical protein
MRTASKLGRLSEDHNFLKISFQKEPSEEIKRKVQIF